MSKVISYLNNIKIYHRTDLWFGKYDHSVKIWLHEAACLRHLDREKVKKIIRRRREWGRKMVASVGNPKQPGSWQWVNLDITQQDERNITNMLDFLLAERRDFRKSISNDWIYFYSNDITFINDVVSLPWLPRPETIQRSQIIQTGTPGTVRLRQAQHQYRSYFKGWMKLSEKQETALAQYLANLQGISPSPSLRDWIEDLGRKKYIGDYFFIDHDDKGILTMLNLIVPGIIRRTKPIDLAK